MEDLGHGLRGRRRVFRRLDHAAIAGSENARQWRERQVHGEIPGTDHAHHAERLIFDPRLRPQQVQWKIHLAVKDEWLKAPEKIPAGMIIDIKLDPYERSPETAGHFLWMKEKSWILPQIASPIKAFAKSMQDFPPRQKGSGIGAAAILNQLESRPTD